MTTDEKLDALTKKLAEWRECAKLALAVLEQENLGGSSYKQLVAKLHELVAQ
jgi:hypothetical protein